jgi:hypothetical protein
MPNPPQLNQARILTLISYLVRRPARASHRLPLIWLNSQEDGTRVLDALVERLRTPRRYLVPHARMTAIPEGPASDIRPLLHTLCVKLAAPRFGGERLWFRHYELVEWLMGLNLSRLGSEDRARKIVTLLRRRHRPSRSQDNDRGSDKIDFGPKYRLAIWLIRRVVPEVLFRAAVSGQIPGFGRRYRWFMNQQYLAPPQSVNFLGFAERLTEGVREPEDADQIDKLLVHAFLQDLRRAYRRPGRIEGWRRTAYPVVLIDNATKGSAGHRLLQLVNDVRNETGQRDPLLVVCSSDDVPQASTQATRLRGVEPDSGIPRNGDPVYRNAVYREWAEALPGSRRARMNTAWDLPISVAHPDDGTDPTSEGIGPRRPPWFARRSVVAAVVVALALFVIGGVDWRYGGGVGCPHTPFRGQVNVVRIDGECVGYSDSSYYRFNDQPGQENLRHVQDTIFTQNRTARDLWERGNRARPYVTLVYLGIFTGRLTDPNEEAYSAEREELEGLAVAQYDNIDRPATAGSPLLNIVIANAGQEMKYVRVVVDMIGRLAAEDPTVVGVIGLDESRDTTAEAIEKLNKIGLPVITSTLSADHLDSSSRLYLQISAPNREQARMITEYSKQVLKVSQAQLYWTTGAQSDIKKDLYVQTLVNDLKVPNSGITVDDRGEFHGSLRGDVCGYSGIVIFAGRWSEFPSFLDTLSYECGSNPPSHMVADDSVNRYMANPTLRRSAPSTIPVTYVSKSALATCEHLRGAQQRRENLAARFFQLIQTPGLLDPQRCGQGNKSPVGERVPMTYDAAMLVLQAVEDLGKDFHRDSPREWDPRSIVPVTVYLKIRQQIHKMLFEGATGTINFSDDNDDPGEPIDRRISLLQVNSVSDLGTPPNEVFHCGHAQPNDDPACRTP